MGSLTPSRMRLVGCVSPRVCNPKSRVLHCGVARAALLVRDPQQLGGVLEEDPSLEPVIAPARFAHDGERR